MISQEILTDLSDVTDMHRNAVRTLRGDALKNFTERVLEPELAKLEAKIPGFCVQWCQEYRKYAIFVA
jgi:hypothetical protein